MTTPRYEAVAAPLPDGDVLIAGGYSSRGVLSSAVVFVSAAQVSIAGGNLGNVVVGEPSQEQALTVENVGAQSLQIARASLSGGQAGDFATVADGCTGRALAHAQTCQITVQFTPTKQAAESTTLTLADNEQTPASVALSETGVAPDTGPQGPQGPQGPTGPTGPAGAPGEVIFTPCPRASGSAHGTRIGRLKLDETRHAAARAYRDSSNRGQAYEEFFCLTPTGIRVGFASPTLLGSLPPARRRRYLNRVIWISSANPRYAIHGIRAGDSLRSARRHLASLKPFPVGRNSWYLAPDGKVTAILKDRHGIVQEAGIAERALTATPAADRIFLRSFH